MSNQQIPKRYRAEPGEVLFYSTYAYNDQLIRCKLRIDGQIDEKRMRRAARLALDAEPTTGCRMVLEKGQMVWERHADLDSMELSPVVEVESLEKGEEIALDFFLRQIDPMKDLVIQIFIVRSQTDTICFKAHHSAADAGGLTEYMHLVFDIYNQLKTDPSWLPSINTEGSRSLMQVSKHMSLIDKLKSWRRIYRDYKIKTEPSNLLNIPVMHDGLSDRTLITRTIDKELFQKINQYRREKKVSFNDFMMAIFASTWFRMLDSKEDVPVQFVFTSNFRNHYLPSKKAEAVCNLSGTSRINIYPKSGVSFDMILDQVHEQIAAMKNDYMGVFFFPISKLSLPPFEKVVENRTNLFEKHIKHFQETGINNQPLGLTNIGIIDMGNSTPDHLKVLEAFFLPPTGCVDMTFALSGFNGTVTLAVGVCDAQKNKKKLEYVFDMIIREIHEQLGLPTQSFKNIELAG